MNDKMSKCLPMHICHAASFIKGFWGSRLGLLTDQAGCSGFSKTGLNQGRHWPSGNLICLYFPYWWFAGKLRILKVRLKMVRNSFSGSLFCIGLFLFQMFFRTHFRAVCFWNWSKTIDPFAGCSKSISNLTCLL